MKYKSSQAQGQPYRWEAVLVGLCKGIPFNIGRRLRQSIYRSILAELGPGVSLEPGIDLICSDRIVIKGGSKLERDVRIRNLGSDSWVHLHQGVVLDRGVDIKTHHKGAIEIGSCTYIGPYTCLSGDDIKIGRDCLIASHTGIYANNHIFADPTRPIQAQGNSYRGIVIEDDCWLGSGVRVLDGVHIGQGSVIGAGAVVTKDIPAYAIAVGVPARVISYRTPSSNLISHLSQNNSHQHAVSHATDSAPGTFPLR